MTQLVYFNEFEPFAAQWIRNLHPDSTVDERDIRQVDAASLTGFRRCHFFAGIAGWEYALSLAGWPAWRPAWTGSCPCQPLSSAGRRQGEKDERHLWPEFYRLIGEHRPGTVFGEQVGGDDGLEWLDGVSLDLEELGYAVAAADLCAAGQAAPHPRQRLFWVAYAGCSVVQRQCRSSEAPGANESAPREASERERCWIDTVDRRPVNRLGLANGAGSQPRRQAEPGTRHGAAALATSGDGGLGDAWRNGVEARQATVASKSRAREGRTGSLELPSAWSDYRIVQRRNRTGGFDYCRVSAQPGDEPVAYGIPRDLGRRFPELRSVARDARANRVGRLRGYGNAIVPQVAAQFVRAFLEATEPTP